MARRSGLLVVLAVTANACSSSPSPPEVKAMTHVIDDTGATRLGRAVAPVVDAHPGQAGIL